MNSVQKEPFITKEVSWLAFNARVLQEAEDTAVPLISRIRFLGIYSSNLDEFFRVRVATVKRLCKLRRKAIKLIGDDPKKVLREIQAIVRAQQKRFDAAYAAILKELAVRNVFIVDESTLTAEQSAFVQNYFASEVRPRLTPIMVDARTHMPELADKGVFLAVHVAQKAAGECFALIEMPDTLPRFITLPKTDERTHIILLDDVIRAGLAEIFSLFEPKAVSAYTIKITRDAELDIDDDLTESYVTKVHKSVKKRKEGTPVRFIHDEKMPQHMLTLMLRKFNAGRDDAVIAGGRYHNFKNFMNFPNVTGEKLDAPPRVLHPAFTGRASIFAAVDERDVLLQTPYQSFDSFVDLLREAAIDPSVTQISITMYRLARTSTVVNALLNAVRNGKSVTAVVELTARFDEEANIAWAGKLHDEGVKVVYGLPGLKVHSKLCLITRRTKRSVKRYAVIGTGNFNEDTAKVYTDHFLFTADKRLTADVEGVFDIFRSQLATRSFKHLVVAPFTLRREFYALIEREIRCAEEHKPCGIRIKVNNFSDKAMIAAVCEASAAGVPVKLIVRGMFSLVNTIPGVSDRIEAISIVDRYLEHTRLFIFENGGDARVYLSSADWLPRNFDRRIEAACPIYDERIKKELIDYFDIQWRDNVKARVLEPTFANTYRRNDEPPLRAQDALSAYIRSGKMPPR